MLKAYRLYNSNMEGEGILNFGELNCEQMIDMASSWKFVKNLDDNTQTILERPDAFYCPWENGRDFARITIPDTLVHGSIIKEILNFWSVIPDFYHDCISHIIFYWKSEPLFTLKNSLIMPSPNTIVQAVYLDSIYNTELFQQYYQKKEISRRRRVTIGLGLVFAGIAALFGDFKNI